MRAAVMLRSPEDLRAHLAAAGERVGGEGSIATVRVELGPDLRTAIELRWLGGQGALDLVVPVPLPATEATMSGLAGAIAALGAEAWSPGLIAGAKGPEYGRRVPLSGEGAIAAAALAAVLDGCRAHLREHLVGLCAAALAGPRRPVPGSAPVPAGAVSLALAARIREMLRVELPSWAGRLDGPLHVEEVPQPFFRRHVVLHVQSPSPMPALGVHVVSGEEGAPGLLSGRVEALCAVARRDPPDGLTDPALARAYVHLTGDWTRAAPHPALIVESFAEIPWRRGLPAADAARLERTLAASIRPQRFEPTDRGWRHTAWLLSGTDLVHQVTDLRWNGELARDARIAARSLPVPSGAHWGQVDGRLVPIG